MKHLSLARVIAYLAGVFPVLQQFIPSLIPAPYGIVVGAVIGIVGTAVHQVYQAVSPSTVLPPPVAKMLLAGVMIPMLLAMSACASTSAFFGSPNGQATIIAVVDIAVATAEQKGVSAAEINSLAKVALEADSSTTATLSTVNSIINAKLTSLPALDQNAVQILEVALDAAIAAKVQGNANLASAQAATAQILQAVIAATGG